MVILTMLLQHIWVGDSPFFLFQLTVEVDEAKGFDQIEIIHNKSTLNSLLVVLVGIDQRVNLIEFRHGIVEFLLFHKDHAFQHQFVDSYQFKVSLEHHFNLRVGLFVLLL